MGRRVLTLGASIALGLAAASAALAENKSAVTAEEIRTILADAGLFFEMTTDGATGAPVAVGKSGDIVFYVRALDCSGTPLACENLMFFANWDLGREATAEDYLIVNRFNDGQLFGRAYVLQSRNQVGVEYVIELGGGVSPDHIAQNVSRWANVIKAFIDNFRSGQGSS